LPYHYLEYNNDSDSILESRDLHHRYIFQSHYLAIWLLRFVGFRCITDQTFIREETMYYHMKAGEAIFLTQLAQISFEFQFRRPSVRSIVNEHEISKYIKKVFSVVNYVLRKMYGIEICRVPKKIIEKNFYITRTKIGQRFVFISPNEQPPMNDPRPYIVSHLTPVNTSNDIVVTFLDNYFYDKIVHYPEDTSFSFDST